MKKFLSVLVSLLLLVSAAAAFAEEAAAPIQIGQVVIEKVCGSGVPVIATKSVG